MEIMLWIGGAYALTSAAFGIFGLANTPRGERTLRGFLNVTLLWPAVFFLGRAIDREVDRQSR